MHLILNIFWLMIGADIIEYGVVYNDTYGNRQNLCVNERKVFED